MKWLFKIKSYNRANLLYKLGQKQEAIFVEEQALCFADKKNIKRLEETLRKIKVGEKNMRKLIQSYG
jgi:hypothetical protein